MRGMAKRKITPELWADLVAAYDAWNPADPHAPSMDELLAPFGISKQAFYAERRRQNLPNKSDWRTTQPVVDPTQQVTALLEALVDARLRIRELELRNRELEARLT